MKVNHLLDKKGYVRIKDLKGGDVFKGDDDLDKIEIVIPQSSAVYCFRDTDKYVYTISLFDGSIHRYENNNRVRYIPNAEITVKGR